MENCIVFRDPNLPNQNVENTPRYIEDTICIKDHARLMIHSKPLICLQRRTIIEGVCRALSISSTMKDVFIHSGLLVVRVRRCPRGQTGFRKKNARGKEKICQRAAGSDCRHMFYSEDVGCYYITLSRVRSRYG